MNNKIALLFAVALIATHAQASEEPTLTIGGAAKSMDKSVTPNGETAISIVSEGAGKLTVDGRTVHFYALCKITDRLEGKKVVDGVGDCELGSTAGGTASAHFQTSAGHGDRGHLSFSDGSKDFAAITARVPVVVTVNPGSVGKPVFLVESSTEAAVTQ